MLLLLLCLTIVNADIQQLHILFRHGERSPTSTYPNDPHKNHQWHGGLGQLTLKGKLQMYQLGEKLRQHYSFIPIYYYPVEVNFTSSPLDRCLMSAELVGAGLFPPKDDQVWNPDLLWQPIPIHYLPRNLDNLLAMKSNCTEYDKEFQEVQESTKVMAYNEAYKELYSFLSDNTGTLINSIEGVETLYNIFEIYQMNNMSLPVWLNDTLMAKMRVIAAENLAIYSETNYMKKMKGGFFLKTIANLMESNSAPSINLYAGHDLTLVHVMRTLNLIDTLKPDLGATLVFEFHSNGEIKVFYWNSWEGEIDEQILPNCSPCMLNTLTENYKDVLPVNWVEECQIR